MGKDGRHDSPKWFGRERNNLRNNYWRSPFDGTLRRRTSNYLAYQAIDGMLKQALGTVLGNLYMSKEQVRAHLFDPDPEGIRALLDKVDDEIRRLSGEGNDGPNTGAPKKQS